MTPPICELGSIYVYQKIIILYLLIILADNDRVVSTWKIPIYSLLDMFKIQWNVLDAATLVAGLLNHFAS
jgi:hypothetical protein